MKEKISFQFLPRTTKWANFPLGFVCQRKMCTLHFPAENVCRPISDRWHTILNVGITKEEERNKGEYKNVE
jgi:hypothetical protein